MRERRKIISINIISKIEEEKNKTIYSAVI